MTQVFDNTKKLPLCHFVVIVDRTSIRIAGLNTCETKPRYGTLRTSLRDFLVYGMEISLVQPYVTLITLTLSPSQQMNNNRYLDDTNILLRTLISESLFYINTIFMSFTNLLLRSFIDILALLLPLGEA